jgi:hypothetical protein
MPRSASSQASSRSSFATPGKGRHPDASPDSPDKSARRPVVGQASPHEVHVVYFRHAPDDHRRTEMSSQAAPRRCELATSDPLGIGVPTNSAVAPPEFGFCYHAATTLTRTRTHEAKVWSVGILGFLRG